MSPTLDIWELASKSLGQGQDFFLKRRETHQIAYLTLLGRLQEGKCDEVLSAVPFQWGKHDDVPARMLTLTLNKL